MQFLVELRRRHVNSARERSYCTTFNLEFDLEDDLEDPVFWDIGPIVEDFFNIMPLDEVKTLDFQVPAELYLEPGELRYMFGGMSKTLKSLKIAGTVAFALPNVLKSTATDALLSFPRLKSLTLVDFNFQVEQGPTFLRLLRDALEHRTQSDPTRILHMLSFKDCYFAIDGVPTLKEFRGCCETLLLPRDDELHKLDCSDDYVTIEAIYGGTLSFIPGSHE